jgi:hypothetical protein
VNIGFKMTDDDNLSIPNSTIGTCTDSGHEVGGDELTNDMKLEMVDLKVFKIIIWAAIFKCVICYLPGKSAGT